MSEQVLRRNVTGRSKVRTLAQIAMLGAVATVLMLFEFPLPFIAPPFYELDFSEVPILVGAFAMGPLAGVAIEAIKILLNFVNVVYHLDFIKKYLKLNLKCMKL